ncbi:hypothetical protein ATN84_07510 [Paramesorhizobium deserti]|uniref:Uncharacterized protein n=1 Tax=Paramesorhizobium deserti TaxID=1494590 RepID=A0A135HVN2_9HYPH|nr:hypothetical protein ATN84_07510 [Paramesorhizobium deserti]
MIALTAIDRRGELSGSIKVICSGGCASEEVISSIGKLCTGPAAAEQRKSQSMLQQLHAPAHRGLGQFKGFCGAAKTAELRYP